MLFPELADTAPDNHHHDDNDDRHIDDDDHDPVGAAADNHLPSRCHNRLVHGCSGIGDVSVPNHDRRGIAGAGELQSNLGIAVPSRRDAGAVHRDRRGRDREIVHVHRDRYGPDRAADADAVPRVRRQPDRWRGDGAHDNLKGRG